MEITADLAQPIVDRAIAILERNVNIMNAAGIIVASGDPQRIGSFHQGAAQVVRGGRPVEVAAADAERLEGVRPGVNLPVRLDGQVVGVVGITGRPEEVRPFGQLIGDMVQLMLSQAHTAALDRIVRTAREYLLRQLLASSRRPTAQALHDATLLGLTESGRYQVYLCDPGQEPDAARFAAAAAQLEAVVQRHAPGLHLVAGPWDGRLVLLLAAPLPATLGPVIQAALGEGATVAAGLVGDGLSGLAQSYRSALAAFQAGRMLAGAGSYTAERLYLESALLGMPREMAQGVMSQVLAGLPPVATRMGQQLRESIFAFARSGLSLSTTAEQLGIHRHTLVYRLDQVAKATGRDPRNWDGVILLYLALLMERLFGQTVQ